MVQASRTPAANWKHGGARCLLQVLSSDDDTWPLKVASRLETAVSRQSKAATVAQALQRSGHHKQGSSVDRQPNPARPLGPLELAGCRTSGPRSLSMNVKRRALGARRRPLLVRRRSTPLPGLAAGAPTLEPLSRSASSASPPRAGPGTGNLHEAVTVTPRATNATEEEKARRRRRGCRRQ